MFRGQRKQILLNLTREECDMLTRLLYAIELEYDSDPSVDPDREVLDTVEDITLQIKANLRYRRNGKWRWVANNT